MRRSLVLTDETARHPFRASLPPHVRKVEEAESLPQSWRLTASDVRGVATTYFATFAATLAFLV
ncbi:hypothetical protein A9995_12230 [Erythrobacter sp. QSSC1-22B]|uniref:hypothetical protein n=1 Tax=Erythrobacter sp. QSSC1-22B TaxID=1860125 RepID=UPI000804A535|nr:hypothetical protein [Erythrobacter sp. QSSC1-22B]OBX18256.1 hypothetical protein A9995_12230 [Erythrobacter sp. QSSC1-22B]